MPNVLIKAFKSYTWSELRQLCHPFPGALHIVLTLLSPVAADPSLKQKRNVARVKDVASTAEDLSINCPTVRTKGPVLDSNLLPPPSRETSRLSRSGSSTEATDPWTYLIRYWYIRSHTSHAATHCGFRLGFPSMFLTCFGQDSEGFGRSWCYQQLPKPQPSQGA